MRFVLCDLLFDYVTMDDLLVSRLLSVAMHRHVDDVCKRTETIPRWWSKYYNVHGLEKLFANVRCYHNVGHRGHILNTHILLKVEKLWLDAPLSTFSFLQLAYNTNTVRHLTLTCISDPCDLINTASNVEWPHLECLCIITKSVCCRNLRQTQWVVPVLTRIMVGSPHEYFPLCILGLPYHNINELCIVGAEQSRIASYLSLWSMHFWSISRCIQSSSMRILRLFHIVPQNDICFRELIFFVNQTSIENLHIHPISIRHACFVLTCTRLNLFVHLHPNLRLPRLNALKQAFAERLHVCY